MTNRIETENTNTFEIGVEYTTHDCAELVLVPRHLFYEFALKDDLFQHVNDMTIDRPSDAWFRWKTSPDLIRLSSCPLKYIPSRVGMNGSSIYFSNGRHRAKWLVYEKLSRIPVLMSRKSMDKANEMGLVSEIVTGDRSISIPRFDYKNMIRPNVIEECFE